MSLLVLSLIPTSAVAQLLARTETRLSAASTPDGFFGYFVAIQGDTALVGAPVDDGVHAGTGSVYVFVRSAGVWSQQAKLTASDGGAGDDFGVSMAIDGDTVVVGAVADDDQGADAGAAYVFVRSGSVWTEQAKLTAPDGFPQQYYGQAVAISGETIVVGAFYDDDAGPYSGSVYVYTRSGTVWTQQAKFTGSDTEADDYFGVQLALSGDTLVVGAPEEDTGGSQAGVAYVFVRAAGVWTEQARLVEPNPGAGHYFGDGIAVLGDTAVIGRRSVDALPGVAWVFVRAGVTWNAQAMLTATDGVAGNLFGQSPSLDGDTVVIGALADPEGGANAGGAYVLSRAGTTWTQQLKLIATDAAPDAAFGARTAISGTNVIVGAAYTGAGAAYIYDLAPGQNVGGALRIRNKLPDDVTRNSVRFSARAATITVPLPTSSDDPRCGAGNGGSFRVSSIASGQSFVQALACARWTAIGDTGNPRGYRYEDPDRTDGPCRLVSIKRHRVAAKCSGHGASALGYDLQPGQSELPVTAYLELGTVGYCGRFGGRIRRDGSDGRTFTAAQPSTTTACE